MNNPPPPSPLIFENFFPAQSPVSVVNTMTYAFVPNEVKPVRRRAVSNDSEGPKKAVITKILGKLKKILEETEIIHLNKLNNLLPDNAPYSPELFSILTRIFKVDKEILFNALSPAKIRELITKDKHIQYQNEIKKSIRMCKFSVEESLAMMYFSGVSLQKYKKIREFLEHKGIGVLCSGTDVSSLQAASYAKLAVSLGAQSLESKEGVRLQVRAVMNNIQERLEKLHVILSDCTFVVRVDGRPNENTFEVLVGVSIINGNKEITFAGGCSCIPLAIYCGEESFAELVRNALPVMNQLRDWFTETVPDSHSLYLGCDMSLFWTICERAGVCPKCSAFTPSQRMHSCNGCLVVNPHNPFIFWIRRYVPCILHMKMRIFTHFMQQMFKRTFKSKYWYSRFVCCLEGIHLRWQIYSNSDNDNYEKIRIPAFKGNEIDKIMSNLDTIIIESVSPTEEISVDWDLKKLRAWVQVHLEKERDPKFAKYRTPNALQSVDKNTLLVEVFDYIRLSHMVKLDDSNEVGDSVTAPEKIVYLPKDGTETHSCLELWNTIKDLFGCLKNGREVFSEEEVLSKCSMAKNLFEESKRTSMYHPYEHLLLDHLPEFLAHFPGGIGCFSQNSQERQNGIQQQFVATMCFSGNSARILPDEQNEQTFLAIEERSVEQRIDLGTPQHSKRIPKEAFAEVMQQENDQDSDAVMPFREVSNSEKEEGAIHNIELRTIPDLNLSELGKLTAKQLRDLCSRVQLPSSGTKAILVNRLHDSFTQKSYTEGGKPLPINRRDKLARQLLQLFMLDSFPFVQQHMADCRLQEERSEAGGPKIRRSTLHPPTTSKKVKVIPAVRLVKK